MKKYRLLKDTPTAVAGTICTTPGDQEHIIVDPYGVEYYVAKIDNLEEWFEEVKEFEEWGPKDGEEYKALFDGRIYTYYVQSVEDRICNFHVTTGNCYPLDTPNEVIIKEQQLIPQAMHRLKMAAKKAWFEYDGSEGPDWVDHNPVDWRYCIEFDHETYSFKINGYDSLQILGVVYFPTEDSCQAYIDSNKDDLKLLFGVE